MLLQLQGEEEEAEEELQALLAQGLQLQQLEGAMAQQLLQQLLQRLQQTQQLL